MKNILFNLKRCKMFLINCQKELILLFIFSIITTIISAIVPALNGGIINKIQSREFKLLIALAFFLGLLQIIYTIFNMLISKNYLTFRKKLILNIRKIVYRSILDLNIDIYSLDGQGMIINKIKDDSKNIAVFLNNIKDSLLSVITNAGILIYIFYLNIIVGFCYLIAIIILLSIQYYGVKKSMFYQKKLLEVNDSNSTLIAEVIKGAKDVKTLKLKDKFIKKTDNSFDKISEYEYKSNIYLEYSIKISNFIGTCFSGLVIIVCLLLIKWNLLTISSFIIIFMYKSSIYNFSSKITNIINNIEKFNLSVNRVFSILDYNKEQFGNKNIINYNGMITLKNVSFSYDKNDILKNINLEIKSNEFVVIEGDNGAGKTTLFSLITKILSPNKGEIYLDNYNILELTEKSIRENISLVTQQPYIFNLSIKENLSMINDNMDEIKRVCKLVGINKKIDSLEKGYDTVLREDATNLSGGEKQKLAIARALLNKSKVLLLDEITNNLDDESKESIIKLIEKLKGKYTILMITHDSKVKSGADSVFKLTKGKIVRTK